MYRIEVLVGGEDFVDAVRNIIEGNIEEVEYQPYTHEEIRTSETSSEKRKTEFYKEKIEPILR